MSDIWYYIDHNGQVGPLSLHDLKETLATLDNLQKVFVWCDGFPDWKLVKDVPELSEHTGAPPPPPLEGQTATGLISCPECRRQISPKATVCPHCGRPIKKLAEHQKQQTGCLVLLLVLLILGPLIFVEVKFAPEPSPEVKAQRLLFDLRIEACTYSEEAVREQLKAPATAVFPNCGQFKINMDDARENFAVVGYVDAQNGFGALIRSPFEVKLRRNGALDTAGKWYVVSAILK